MSRSHLRVLIARTDSHSNSSKLEFVRGARQNRVYRGDYLAAIEGVSLIAHQVGPESDDFIGQAPTLPWTVADF